jgi:hypothetical protein
VELSYIKLEVTIAQLSNWRTRTDIYMPIDHHTEDLSDCDNNSLADLDCGDISSDADSCNLFDEDYFSDDELIFSPTAELDGMCYESDTPMLDDQSEQSSILMPDEGLCGSDILLQDDINEDFYLPTPQDSQVTVEILDAPAFELSPEVVSKMLDTALRILIAGPRTFGSKELKVDTSELHHTLSDLIPSMWHMHYRKVRCLLFAHSIKTNSM